MSRDETFYQDAGAFNPDRFEGEAGNDILDPRAFAFGFGRRYVWRHFLCLYCTGIQTHTIILCLKGLCRRSFC